MDFFNQKKRIFAALLKDFEGARYKKFKKFLIFMPELKAIASQIRRDIVRMVHGSSSGHPGGSLGCTEFFTALYFKIMKHDPSFNMNATNEDVFFLSNGPVGMIDLILTLY